jgi:hypothetical protein
MKVYEIGSENDLRDSFIAFLKKRGIWDYKIEFCPSAGWSIIDLVYVDERRGLVCVELKLKDWRKVIKQAQRLKACTPWVYIAMPMFATHYKRKQVQTEAQKAGLGLYWFKKDGSGWEAVALPTRLSSGEGCINDILVNAFYKRTMIAFIAQCVEQKTLKQLEESP